MASDPAQMALLVKRAARDLGFDACGIASAGETARPEYLAEWLAKGYAGTMGYLHRHQDSRRDVRSWLPWAKSVIVVALNYFQQSPSKPTHEPRGRVAMYAWGEDYHVVLKEKLERLIDQIKRNLDGAVAASAQFKVCVDTSAIIEREWAAAAGIGWIAKNTMVLNKDLGSFFFLGEIITDLDLEPDAPVTDHCGTCTRCLDACPTDAFPEPHVMDARRCISYLTIEHRSDIEPELAAQMQDWIFGCDICQDVCPFNRQVPETTESRFRLQTSHTSRDDANGMDAAFPSLSELQEWGETEYQRYTKGRASERARFEMWKRNTAIATSNTWKSTEGK